MGYLFIILLFLLRKLTLPWEYLLLLFLSSPVKLTLLWNINLSFIISIAPTHPAVADIHLYYHYNSIVPKHAG